MPRNAALSKKPPIRNGSKRTVRGAGPEAMRDPPEKWDQVDQAADQSFPASDPPPTVVRGVKKDDAVLEKSIKQKFREWHEAHDKKD